ncbi:MAG: gliding motility-associated C-terminal domain-containing protein, partial [Elusimicrobiota bacterium]|nr:gliding motility-associated C-terminal domain-containing protein [Endomicrobiia bacterium]MDW8166359.1 gliding motility-associated C-terminal domain-containing protein [Elusimicrobiota bacterium]
RPRDTWSPSKITDLFVEIFENKLKLTWTAPTENSGLSALSPVAGYYVGYSTVPIENFAGNSNLWWSYANKIVINYASKPGEKEVYVTPPIFMYNTTYYIAIRSYDDAEIPNISDVSDIISIYTKFKDDTIPREVLGLRGSLNSDATKLTISWSRVEKNTDGSVCVDLAEYRIYRSEALSGGYVLRDIVPSTTQQLSWTEPQDIRGKIYYYYVTAVDIYGNESDKVMILKIADDINIIFFYKDDYFTNIYVPYEQKKLLYKDMNEYTEDIKIEFIRDVYDENRQVLRAFSLVAKRGSDLKPVNNFVFEKPVRLAFTIPSERNVAVFWYNGLEWINLGGELDIYFKTISINTTRLGKYTIKLTVRSNSFEIIAIQPDKIFTPNNDGWNDFFEIIYDNPKNATVVGRIFDIKGRFVADMKKGYSDNSLIWDGKDSNGNLQPGGVYIYQIEVFGSESKTISGTCVIAR